MTGPATPRLTDADLGRLLAHVPAPAAPEGLAARIVATAGRTPVVRAGARRARLGTPLRRGALALGFVAIAAAAAALTASHFDFRGLAALPDLILHGGTRHAAHARLAPVSAPPARGRPVAAPTLEASGYSPAALTDHAPPPAAASRPTEPNQSVGRNALIHRRAAVRERMAARAVHKPAAADRSAARRETSAAIHDEAPAPDRLDRQPSAQKLDDRAASKDEALARPADPAADRMAEDRRWAPGERNEDWRAARRAWRERRQREGWGANAQNETRPTTRADAARPDEARRGDQPWRGKGWKGRRFRKGLGAHRGPR